MPHIPVKIHSPLRVAMVAGEASGDLLGGLLLEGLKQRWPDIQAFGIGGPQLERGGFQALWPSRKLAVRGYVEVLRHYCEIVDIRKQLLQRLLGDPPDIFIGIDAPDFNLALETQLKARGVKTVHFVSPSIWAWRPERIDKIRHAVDHMLCIFPFEKSLYDQAGIAATYVGHPLADKIPLQPDRAVARQSLGLAPSDQVVAILPGSRQSEVQYLAEIFFKTAAQLNKASSAIKFVVPCAPGLKNTLAAYAQSAGVENIIQLIEGQSHVALAACDVTLIASGTATLEAALFKRPMVIAYNMHWLSWQMMKRKKLQPWVGLPNILCNEFVVPEFLQDAATAQALSQAILEWLSQPEKIQFLQQRFTALHIQLQQDTAHLASHAIAQVIAS
jgi:lipid-A-disaccharide synthase